jgi:hypothetical protein
MDSLPDTALLARTIAVYDCWVEVCNSFRSPNVTANLRSIAELAEFAARCHAGRFADGVLDNALLDLGANLPDTKSGSARRWASTGSRGVVHVATVVFPVGGHTRTIKNWVLSDTDTRHWLYLTNQGGVQIPDWLIAAVRATGGDVIASDTPHEPLAVARELRRFAAEAGDLVVLHHSSSDVVPGLAFATRDVPPVAVLNHADHKFWLGSSVCDLLINQRDESQRLGARRHTPVHSTLPIPLDAPAAPLGCEEARRRLGIPNDQTVLVTIGRTEKFFPTPEQNFFRTLGSVLDRCPNSCLYVVGVSRAEAQVLLAGAPHSRIHFCGELEDPSTHRAAADVYLDPFPFGSATSFLEACLHGKAAALAYAPPLDLLTTNHGLGHLLQNARDEVEYVDQLTALVRSKERRVELGESLRDHVLAHHTGEGWRRTLQRTCAAARSRPHAPRALPRTRGEFFEPDVRISWWLTHSAGRDLDPDRYLASSIFDLAYVTKCEGDYRGAVALLARALARGRGDRRYPSALVKSLLQWLVGKRSRTALRSRV